MRTWPNLFKIQGLSKAPLMDLKSHAPQLVKRENDLILKIKTLKVAITFIV